MKSIFYSENVLDYMELGVTPTHDISEEHILLRSKIEEMIQKDLSILDKHCDEIEGFNEAKAAFKVARNVPCMIVATLTTEITRLDIENFSESDLSILNLLATNSLMRSLNIGIHTYSTLVMSAIRAAKTYRQDVKISNILRKVMESK